MPPVPPSPAVLTRSAGFPAVAVPVNVTGDPISPATAACAVWAPAVAPRVRVAVAMPLAFVGPVAVIVPAGAVHVTVTPAIGVLLWSRTSMAYGVPRGARTVSVWLFPDGTARVIWVAPWMVAMALNVIGEPARPARVAVVVWTPAFGPSVRVIDAMPSTPDTVVVALTAPPPPTAQFTVTPWTGALLASRTSTCKGARAVPAGATWLSPAWIAICVAVVLGVVPPSPPHATTASRSTKPVENERSAMVHLRVTRGMGEGWRGAGAHRLRGPT